MVFVVYVHNIDTFNPMSKGSKSFGKLRLRPFQPYHPMLCMLKGLKVILTFDPFDMLQHT